MNYKHFHEDLRALASVIRDRLAKAKGITEFNLEITISGRVVGGDLKIEAELRGGWNDRSVVKGGDIDAIVKEFLRRKGWDETNAPLCISYVEPEEIEADAP